VEFSQQYVQDYIAIRDISARFNRYSDFSQGAELAQLFTEDGEWDIQGDRVHKGWAEIEAKCQGDVIVHMHVDPIIEIDGDEATQSARLFVTSKAPDGSSVGFVTTGMYLDKLVRTPTGWKFKVRRVELDLQLTEIEKHFAALLEKIGLDSSRLGVSQPAS
jgi:hypothetical protein